MNFIQAYQILPGITIHELKKEDKLGRYVNMGRNITDAPYMYFDRASNTIHVGEDIFPLSSIFRFRLTPNEH